MDEIPGDSNLRQASSFWETLEESAGRNVFQFEWERKLGEMYPVIRDSFLKKTAWNKDFPLGMTTNQNVVRRLREQRDKRLAGKSKNDTKPVLAGGERPYRDEIILGWIWQDLCRSVARAFGLFSKYGETSHPATRQIGELSDLPILLTIPSDENSLRIAAALLVVELNHPFVLLAPTRRFYNVKTSQLLSRSKAGFFDLESQLSILPNGSLEARHPGGELFSPYLSEQNTAPSENDAVRLFALFEKLKLETNCRKASLQEVFTLLVLDKISQAAVAKKLKCSEGTISARVKVIEDKMHCKIEILRNSASQLRNMEIEKDPQARTLYRKGLTDDTKSDDDDSY
jgi:hypothetical protein